MERRAFLYGASADAPQGVYRPPVRREISQWGREPFGGTIEDNHFPKLQLHYYICPINLSFFFLVLSICIQPVYQFREFQNRYACVLLHVGEVAQHIGKRCKPFANHKRNP